MADRLTWIVLYWAEDDDGEIVSTHPENVGSRTPKWTTFLFTARPVLEDFVFQTAVLLSGDHGQPSDVVIREAEFSLFGAVAN